MPMKHYAMIFSVALLMAGCGSTVKLDDVPVVDRSTGGASDQAGVQGGGGTGADASGVSPTEISAVELKDQAVVPAGQDAVAADSRLIYFDYDSFTVKPEYQAMLEANARKLIENPGTRIFIEGHTDERGGREYNLALGQKRAEAVFRALGLLGVPDKQMEPISLGEEKPAALGNSESAWSQNRRAEISYR